MLANLEKARSGYALLEQLAMLRPNDLDGLYQLLSKWTVLEATTVLEELHKRLALIKKLSSLIDDPSADELHDLQPLFERGLWIFGPEYESVEFSSNRSLSNVVRTLFRDQDTELSTPRRRPDFIVLPDSSIGIYSCDSYGENGEVSGLNKVVILELKRGGFELTRREMRQAEDYEFEIRKSGKIVDSTTVIAFVLGSKLGQDARSTIKKGDPENTFIYPEAYSTVLRRAHARTFNLNEKLRKASDNAIFDPDVERIIRNSPVGFDFRE